MRDIDRCSDSVTAVCAEPDNPGHCGHASTSARDADGERLTPCCWCGLTLDETDPYGCEAIADAWDRVTGALTGLWVALHGPAELGVRRG